jgi:hypothetical protein
MAIQTRDMCGFNNGTANIAYSFDDSLNPPLVSEFRFRNDGDRDIFNVDLTDRTSGQVVQSFSRSAKSGEFVLPRTAPGQQPSIQRIFGGDLFMVDVTGKDGSHGWDLPYRYTCWTS